MNEKSYTEFLEAEAKKRNLRKFKLKKLEQICVDNNFPTPNIFGNEGYKIYIKEFGFRFMPLIIIYFIEDYNKFKKMEGVGI